ncbi:MAG: hypothetical protein E6772_08220 [Dysgonomonas sp.]|nr:hypothetical protein [Dysgonomonas sp.]
MMEKKICERCSIENTYNANYCAGCGYSLSQAPTKENTNPITIPDLREKNDSYKPLKTIVGVIVGILVAAGVQKILFQAPSFDKVMVEISNEINKTCPIIVDAETRLDNTSFLLGKTLQYNYTLLSAEAEFIDTLEFKKIMEPQILNATSTSPQMKYFRDNKVSLNYLYKDMHGEYICIIFIKPEQYAKPDTNSLEL